MFAYCGNNPTIGFDPSGEFNWKGFAIGVALVVIGVLVVAAAVTSGGAAIPVVTALTKATATAVGVAIAATGSVTAYSAAREKPMVLDVSVSNGFTHDKKGYSVVVDFKSDSATIDTYYHYGKSTAGYGATYGVGLVSGYEKPGDYGGFFVDGEVSYSHNGFEYGVDMCTDPANPFYGCTAALVTIGTSFAATKDGRVTFCAGLDYYEHIAVIQWD